MRISTVLTAAAIAVTATAAHAERLYGLTFDNRIVTFDSTDPEAILSSRSITGLAMDDELVGIDQRPATGMLYTMSTSGTIYRLERMGSTYQATATGTTSPAPMGGSFGFDFNPVPDRLRLVSDSGQNLRINVDGGATIMDGAIMSDTGAVQLVAAAYTNSVAGATSTTLYALDAVGDMLLRSTNPNLGAYTGMNMGGGSYAPLGFSFTTANAVGFDISGRTGAAFANIDSLLWSIDLGTGRASTLGIVGAGPLLSIATGATVPEPATWAMLIAGFGMVGGVMRRRKSAPRVAIA